MEGWWTLAMPWWHFVVRGIVACLGLLLFLRVTGKRSFGDMSPFDIVVLVVVGGLLRSAIVGGDTSLLGPFIAVASILSVDLLLAWLCARSATLDRLIEGRSITLIAAGKVFRDRLRRHNVPAEALERELRAHGIAGPESVREARLEANGRVSVIKVASR